MALPSHERHRRRSSRPPGETPNLYAACLSARVVVLVIFVVLCSAVDALFTLIHMQQGATEVNPVMAMALAQGIDSFVGFKMSLTGLGVLLLAMHQNFWFGIKGLQFLAVVYSGLLVYHLVVFVSLV
jgi:hypothetical protein